MMKNRVPRDTRHTGSAGSVMPGPAAEGLVSRSLVAEPLS
jgi:hypothetical protein